MTVRCASCGLVGLVMLAAVPVTSSPPPGTDGLVVVPGRQLGVLGVDGSEADLVAAYGAATVRQTEVELGEGERAVATILFPEDERRRLEIIWQDPVARRSPGRATLRGSATAWRLPGGMSLGLSLAEVQRLNGGRFEVAGFAWDGGGIVLSWHGGRLTATLGPAVKVFFVPDDAAQQRPEFLEVQGDRPFASDLPALRALGPSVGRIVVEFEVP